MRLAIIGKTRSGKSTALHRILSQALRHPWAGILLLDGKGSELKSYETLPGVTYLGPEHINQWAIHLRTIANGMTARYAALVERNLRQAPLTDPSWLIVKPQIYQQFRPLLRPHTLLQFTGIVQRSSTAVSLLVHHMQPLS